MTTSAFMSATREILTFAYLRISSDNDGTMVSPDTQWRGIQRVAQRYNLPMPDAGRTFTDRDLSASDPNIVRFDYVRMLKAIDAVDATRYEIVVLAYAQDRVFRQPADWQHFTELVGPDNCDGRLLTDFEGNVDLGAMGIFAAGAGYVEARKTAKRSKDGITSAAISGKGHGPVPYGWDRNYTHGAGKVTSETVIVESEARVIREAADRILAGDKLRNICIDLNSAGVPSPGAGAVRRRDPATREATEWAGSEWVPQKLRQILLRIANKGIREHTSGKGARKTTRLYPADWPAILTDDVYDRMSARLTDPSRRTVTSNTNKYLLSGIGICGRDIDGKPCGRVVSGRINYKGKARTKYLAYSCEKGHVVKSLAGTDMTVVTEVLHVLSQPEVRASLTATPDDDTRGALEREAALLARKDAAADDYAEGRIDGAMMARIASKVNEQLSAVRAAIAATQDITVYSELLSADPSDLESLWEGYDLSYKRSVIRALFDIVLMPSVRTGRGAFDPRSIRIDLRPMRSA